MGVGRDEDPRPIIIDVINEAYTDIGGTGLLFDVTRGALLSSTMAACGITTWESLCENMNRRRTWNRFAIAVEKVIPDIWPDRHASHPVIPLLEAIVCNAALCIARHITYLTNGETKISMNEFRLFGCKDFQANWDRTIIAHVIPFSLVERDDLYYQYEAKGSEGIGAYQDAMIPQIVTNWENPSDNVIMVPDPRDYYSAPFGYSQDELDTEVTDDGAAPTDQEPPSQPEQLADATMVSQDPTDTAPAANDAPGPAALLAFPDKSPLRGKTHLHGRWVPSNSPNKPPEKWIDYLPPITLEQLPRNLTWNDDHWIGRLLPGGTMAYVGMDQSGNRRFITPDHDDWLRMFPEQNTIPPPPVQQGPGNDPNQPTVTVNTVDVSNVTHDTDTSMRFWALTPGAGSGAKKPASGRISWDPSIHTGIRSPHTQIPTGNQSQPTSSRFQAAAANMTNQGFAAHMPTSTRSSNMAGTRGTSGNFFPNTTSGTGTPYTQVPGRAYPLRGGATPAGTTGGAPPTVRPGGTPGSTPPTFPFGGSGGGSGPPPSGGMGGIPGTTPPPFPYGGSGGGSGPPPGGGYTIPTAPTPRRPKWVYKPDLSAYTDLKTPEQFSPWIEDTFFTMVAQGLGNIAEATFTPNPADQEEVDEFQRQQKFTFMMLSKKVTEAMGKRIISNYKRTMDAQGALSALCVEYTGSTHAILARRRTLEILTNKKFDPRGNQTATMFILEFETMAERYNEQQTDIGMILNGTMKKAMLQSALSSVTILRAVADRETERVVQGGAPFSYEEYLTAVKSSAALYDEGRMGRRSVHTITSMPDDCTQRDHGEALVFAVNKQARRVPGTIMNKETWSALSEQGKATWDQLSDQDKRKILTYASKRGEKPRATTNAHVMEVDADDQTYQTDTEDVPDEGLGVNNTNLGRAKSEAHPGDPRRMMGETNNQTAMVKFAQWNTVHNNVSEEDLDKFVDAYWQSSDDDEDENMDF